MINRIFTLPANKEGRAKMKDALMDLPGIRCQRIGKSIMGQEIDLYQIGNGRGRVVYFGAHHALESITCNLLFAFMYELSVGSVRHFDRDIKTLLNAYTYMIVPCVNPDGIDMRFMGVAGSPIAERQISMSGGDFSAWQANARGVDLNHNYNAGFWEYKALETKMGTVPGPTLYSGEYPESEPETSAISNLLRAIKPLGVISLHSQGEEIFPSPRGACTARIAERLSRLCAYRVKEPSGTACYGGLCDFSGVIGIPSFTLEVGRGRNPLPEADIRAIYYRIAQALLLFPSML